MPSIGRRLRYSGSTLWMQRRWSDSVNINSWTVWYGTHYDAQMITQLRRPQDWLDRIGIDRMASLWFPGVEADIWYGMSRSLLTLWHSHIIHGASHPGDAISIEVVLTFIETVINLSHIDIVRGN